MADLWQHLLVTAAAVGAAAWIVRDVRRRRAAKAACERCALVKPPSRVR